MGFLSNAVRTAENGREALAKLREKDSSIDLVLSDVYMPGSYLAASLLDDSISFLSL